MYEKLLLFPPLPCNIQHKRYYKHSKHLAFTVTNKIATNIKVSPFQCLHRELLPLPSTIVQFSCIKKNRPEFLQIEFVLSENMLKFNLTTDQNACWGNQEKDFTGIYKRNSNESHSRGSAGWGVSHVYGFVMPRIKSECAI